MSAVVGDAARVAPPSAGNNNEAALGAATPSPAIDLFAGQGGDLLQNWISLTCSNPFNFVVGDLDTMAAASAGEFFAGGAVVQFKANKSLLRFLRITINAGGDYKWWVSGP